MTKRIIYTIEITYENRPTEVIPLSAKTDKGAMKQVKEYLPREDGGKVFLHFYRSGGGYGEGYLDRDGNSLTVHGGRAWN